MKIAFDHQAFVLQSYGGISRYFTRLVQGMIRLNQQTAIFAPLHRNNYLLSLPPEVVFGRYISSYPKKTARFFLAYNQFLSHAKIARWKPNLVHETYYSRHRSAPRECPTVITVYDMIQELYANEMTLTDNTATNKRIAIERADHVICISENTKLDLMRLYGTPASKISVVHLGFDQFEAQAYAHRSSAFSRKPFLLYVGQRAGYKNFIGFLKAVAISKKLLDDFDIVAFGGKKFSSDELHIINSLDFSDSQVRHISGGDDLLGGLYNEASAFVYPSIYEGFGIPPLEAMAHRCPVISSNTSSMPEVIGSAGEYFNPTDIEDMRRAIEEVVYSKSRTDDLRRLGDSRLTEFSWDKCSKETMNVYRSLAG